MSVPPPIGEGNIFQAIIVMVSKGRMSNNGSTVVSFFSLLLSPFPLSDVDVQSSLCRTRMCTFHDMLHVFDGSFLHEMWLVYGNVHETAGVQLAVEEGRLCTRHHRGQSATRCC